MASFDQMREDLGEVHKDNSQRHWHVMDAIATIEAGIKKLAEYGHVYDLIEGDQSPRIEWPRMYYNWRTGDNLVIPDQDFADALSSDWHPTQPPKAGDGPVVESKDSSPPKVMLGVDDKGNPTIQDQFNSTVEK